MIGYAYSWFVVYVGSGCVYVHELDFGRVHKFGAPVVVYQTESGVDWWCTEDNYSVYSCTDSGYNQALLSFEPY